MDDLEDDLGIRTDGARERHRKQLHGAGIGRGERRDDGRSGKRSERSEVHRARCVRFDLQRMRVDRLRGDGNACERMILLSPHIDAHTDRAQSIDRKFQIRRAGWRLTEADLEPLRHARRNEQERRDELT